MQNAHRYALWERAEMSNILFWTALIIVPVLLGTAYAYLQSIRHRDDF